MPSDRLRFGDIRRTSAFRLTISLGLVFTLGLLALLAAIYLMTARELTERNDRILRSIADRLLAVDPVRLPASVGQEMRRERDGFNYVGLIASDGEQIVGDISIDRPVKPGRPIEVMAGTVPIRLIAVRTGTGETILVGRDFTQVRDLRRRVLAIVAGSGIVILLGVGAGGTWLSLSPLRRVSELQTAARKISQGHFEVRMPITGRRDELDQFAGTVNAMVEEVGRVVAQVKGVTDAIAHDMRTPLMHLRALLDEAADSPEASPAIVALAGRGREELDHVLARFAALLRISEIETGARRSGFRAVNLAALLRASHQLYAPLAEDRGIALEHRTGGLTTIGADEQLLFEALSNLIDNAIKFAGSTVLIALHEEPEGIEIEVRDDGPGIPVSEREAVLRRFHRGSNAADVPGSGLGLSIVVAIAHLHGATLRLEDAHPGLSARLRFPYETD
ncbi:HAMP domain-containing histidine kinase [Sphingomonas sp. AP4-R1]|uniref:sensor histidine kinase n=1 Tax=Sphingomonas sp. AP4-R1 TaxID=2735134 RepID=UPI001493888F|nr:HAMP domain-containing sensor histidine kinase [Sphingomonas sp. AP4-R1]QJU57721.1 HAMP domain-containing histidine kinase [Sphingomonas sp. AP4-R1]